MCAFKESPFGRAVECDARLQLYRREAGNWACGDGFHTNYTAKYPPSTGKIAPVTHDDSSLAR